MFTRLREKMFFLLMFPPGSREKMFFSALCIQAENEGLYIIHSSLNILRLT